MFPLALPWEILKFSGKQNSLFPLGPVIKGLLYHALLQIHAWFTLAFIWREGGGNFIFISVLVSIFWGSF